MILGRPTNLIIGAFTSILGFAVLVAASLTPPIVIPDQIVAAAVIAFGAIVALVANQPPTLNPGDTFKTVTPAGQPNATTVVAAPPAPSQPTMIPPAGG